jgi:hypothetical protein
MGISGPVNVVISGLGTFLVCGILLGLYDKMYKKKVREIDDETGQSFHTANGEETAGGRKSRRKSLKSKRKNFTSKK